MPRLRSPRADGSPVRLRGPVVRAGSRPPQHVHSRPRTLQEAKPKAGSAQRQSAAGTACPIGLETQKSGRTQCPGSTASRICGIRQFRAADHSIQTHRGGQAAVTARGSRRVETSASIRAGSKLRRDEPHERCRRVRSRVIDAGKARSAGRHMAVEHRQVDLPMHDRRCGSEARGQDGTAEPACLR